MREPHPPGEPEAARLAEQLADVRVIDGPRAGQVWTYVPDRGGYMAADGTDETICAEVGAILTHCRAEVVRPIGEDER